MIHFTILPLFELTIHFILTEEAAGHFNDIILPRGPLLPSTLSINTPLAMEISLIMGASSSLPFIHPHRLRAPFLCHCCSDPIPEDNDHIQNTPCEHKICLLCVTKSNMKRISNPACCQVKDCPHKYAIISCQYFKGGIPGEIIENDTITELGTDEVANVLSFLPLEVIMCLRRVNMTWSEAAKKAIVPPTDFLVNSVTDYNAMRVMTAALPNLQQVTIGYLGDRYKYVDGEDPDEEEAARSANLTPLDIGIISNFGKLRILDINEYVPFHPVLNGRYPFLFNSFPMLQKLSIQYCHHLKFDLEMLAGFPLLKELKCWDNKSLTGNISSLRLLKETLEKVNLENCEDVVGNFMDLADFLQLKELQLEHTAVSGDIRDIAENHFSSLELLILPKGVYCGTGYEFHRISDAPDVARAVYLLKKQRPALVMSWDAVLSEDSPDWYDSTQADDDTPPFFISFVQAGSRIGYRWHTLGDNPCEVIWLDPVPERGSFGYEDYVADYRLIEDEIGLYRGNYEPPTEEEYLNSIEIQELFRIRE